MKKLIHCLFSVLFLVLSLGLFPVNHSVASSLQVDETSTYYYIDAKTGLPVFHFEAIDPTKPANSTTNVSGIIVLQVEGGSFYYELRGVISVAGNRFTADIIDDTLGEMAAGQEYTMKYTIILDNGEYFVMIDSFTVDYPDFYFSTKEENTEVSGVSYRQENGKIMATVTVSDKNQVSDTGDTVIIRAQNGSQYVDTTSAPFAFIDSSTGKTNNAYAFKTEIDLSQIGVKIDGSQYNVTITVDPKNSIVEADETNNSGTVLISSSQFLGMDLLVDSVNSYYFVNQYGRPAFHLEAIEQNSQINFDLVASKISLEAKIGGKSSVITPSGIKISGHRLSGDFDFSYLGYTTDGRGYSITFVVDPDNAVSESNESNNSWLATVTFQQNTTSSQEGQSQESSSSTPSPMDYVMLGGLEKLPQSSTVYFTYRDDNGIPYRQAISNDEIFNAYGFDRNKVVTTSSLAEYNWKEPLKFPDGTLIKGTEPEVYIVTNNGLRTWVKSEELFLSLGYRWNQIKKIEDAQLYQYEKIDGWPDATRHPNGTLVKSASSWAIYLLDDGKRRFIDSEAAFTRRGYKFDNIITISDEELASSYSDGVTLSL